MRDATPPDLEGPGFAEVMARLRAGDPEAARLVHDRWAGRLIGLARRKLGASAAAREDPEDVAQSAYRSFFRRQEGGAYRFESWDDVWAMLAVIALRKCANRRAYHAAARRDARREVPLDRDDALADRGPAPDEALELIETVQALLRAVPDADRPIVERSLGGDDVRAISQALGRSERKVQRVRESVRAWLDAPDE